MKVEFEDCVILEVFEGTSKTGNQFGRLQFLTGDCEVFSLFFGANQLDSLRGLVPKTTVEKLAFELLPNRDGGVRLIPSF